jgi:DNA repair exonuclease SbcCD nuclease subunit
MKIAFTADIHMSNNLPFSTIVKNGITDRLLEQRELWKQIYNIVENKKTEALFVLGDLFDHSRVDAVTLTETVRNVVKCPVPIYILPGNHDATTTTGGRFTVEALGEMGNEDVHVIGNNFKPIKFGKTKIWSVSFRTHKEIEKAIRKITKKMKSGFCNVLLLHCSILGAKAYGWQCDDGVNPKYFKSFDHVLAGHFHDSQSFSDNGFYVGSPMQHHFGDVNSPSQILIADFDKNYFIEPTIDMPNFYICDYEDRKEIVKFKKGDFVRFEFELTHSDWIRKKVEVDIFIDNLRKKGIRADYRYRPISQALQRISLPKGDGSISLEKAIGKYVKVSKTELKSKDLIEFGKEVLNSVIRKTQ